MFSIKQLFCSHKLEFIRNIHGDEIITSGWKRSIWQCSKCKKVVLKPKLKFIPSSAHDLDL